MDDCEQYPEVIFQNKAQMFLTETETSERDCMPMFIQNTFFQYLDTSFRIIVIVGCFPHVIISYR